MALTTQSFLPHHFITKTKKQKTFLLFTLNKHMQTMEGRQYYQNPEGNNHSSSMVVPHSPWHSPVPYLFGGLAAMLALIAFSLLILACSYWRLTGSAERDLEAGDDAKPEGDTHKTKTTELPEKFLVIMAGDVKPTYLATPANRSEQSCTCGDHKEEAGSNQVLRQSTGT
ncbi:protein GLUTAMINE DUMPER 2 [Brassica rapa]|nr:protein GLUTAMINE DUMPER 2 [Brassica rapa]